jgi:hypothetical protein
VGSVGSVGSFSHYLVYLETIIFFFYTALKCLLAPLLKTYPCEVWGVWGDINPRFIPQIKFDRPLLLSA